MSHSNISHALARVNALERLTTRSYARRRAPDADAKDRIRADEDLVLNWWTSPTFAVAGVGAAALLLFLFVVVIGPPPSDGRCTLPWC